MIIKTDLLKDKCSKLITAVDSNELSLVTETLELKVEEGMLYFNVTNKDYWVQFRMPVDVNEEFHATVNANLFLKLISQITTPDIELKVSGNSLTVKGNGKYKLPLIFEGDKLLDLPRIDINNVTTEFTVSSEILNSILNFNSSQLAIDANAITKEVQRLYYVDDQGAITMTSGACVNRFNLEKPVRILLNGRLVKLFKLFKEVTVNFSLGYDPLSDEIIQTKVKFETADVTIVAILSCDDTLINSMPVQAIRSRAEAIYPFNANINKDALLQTINRLLLFNSGYGSKENLKPYSKFEFGKTSVTIYDVSGENNETIAYTGTSLDSDSDIVYTTILDIADLKKVLETCVESYLCIAFGKSPAVTLSRGNVINVVPECNEV